MNAESAVANPSADGRHGDAKAERGAATELGALVERALDPSKDWLSEGEISDLILRIRSSGSRVEPRELDEWLPFLEAIRLGLTGQAAEAAEQLRALAERADRARLGLPDRDALASRAWELCGVLFRIGLDPASALKAFAAARRARATCGAADDAAHEARLVHREAEALGSLGRLEEATERLLRVEAAGRALGDELLVARSLASRGSISFENGQLSETAELYERAIVMADRYKAPSHAMIWRGYLGQAELHRGNLKVAEDLVQTAIQSATILGRRDARALFQSILATIRISRSPEALLDAKRLFDDATLEAGAFPLIEGAIRIHALHLRLAQVVERLQSPELDGELSRALAGIATESELLAFRPNPVRGGRALVDDSDDVRLALRLLWQRIEEIRRERSSIAEGVRVEVFSGARAFRVDGRIVSLSAHPTLRKVLAGLVEGSADRPPKAVRAIELAHSVWPGSASEKAKLNRLYVSLAELRAMGLRGTLQKSADGYRVEGAKLLGTRRPPS